MPDKQASALLVRSLELDTISGWELLTKDAQNKLWQFAGEVKEAQWEQGFATLKEAAALYETKKLLPEEGRFREFLDHIYKASWRTGYQRLELYEEARKKLTEEQIAYLIAYGPQLMPYRNVPMGEFLNAAGRLPVPKTDKPEDMNPYIVKVGERFKQLKSERRLGKQAIDPDDAAREAFNTLSRLILNAKIRASKKQLEWLKRVVGMVMQDYAIPNEGNLNRVEIPEGYKAKRGRKPKKQNAA